MSLKEFDERQGEMQKEILQTVNAEDVYGLSKAADPEARQVDQVSKAGSSVSRPVL